MFHFLLLALLVSSTALAADYKVGDHLAVKAAHPHAGYREVSWDDLLPKDWDPMQPMKGLRLDKLKDSDPRATEALAKLRAMWNAAPVNPAMNGAQIRIPGFIVPLEWKNSEVKEFLLVPYFGACIHVPPPPANQIIHVFSDKPYQTKSSMDAVWVNGTLETVKSKSDMGDSGYQLKAHLVEEYEGPRN